ncbi:hypothetical protein PTTG_08161 [Puccinia triticina 1-1 BBBD Race 1]|uniref:Dihydrofolate synthase n=2 Tax=Puccinia triticina TaxID=208348 RepID=A0A0C4F4W9_PUCT1|nr:uncharacterized protein PtA15_5A699 [Puccinia triticina]OAV98884.1 hypothetical protein PTTG_08161 [Puccinia triticina 1-1 BBBD Race 1]WAQ85125.1 hypothetical protein PtA15_5A699 [Puccinia triticina]
MAPTTSIRLGLERIRRLLHCLADPHLQIPIIHVAGTNGKGSVVAYEAEILRRSGYRVGRFTSPFLLDPADSIVLNGHPVDRQTFEHTKTRIHALVAQHRLELTAFELLTALAFQVFASHRPSLDLAVIEVGLGGQLDSTNVAESANTLLSCITPISIDHQAFLGSTVSEIARQKAGIAKPNVPILLAQQSYPEVQPIVRAKASLESSDLFSVRPYPLPHPAAEHLPPLPLMPTEDHLSSGCSQLDLSMHPSRTVPNSLNPDAGFQHQNAATATALAHLLRTHKHPLKLLPSLAEKITDHAIIEGLRTTRWKGRLELAEYRGARLLLDGAHNHASAQVLGDHIKQLGRPVTLLISLSAPRDPGELIAALDLGRMRWPPQLVATTFSVPEDMDWVKPVPPHDIAAQFQLLTSATQSAARIADNPLDALHQAIQIARSKDELIVVCGSLYLVSDILRIIDSTQHQPTIS